MSLSKLPLELVEDHIFAYLPWNDLLRVRSVDKEHRDKVNEYVKKSSVVDKAKAPEIAVGCRKPNAYPNFRAFVKMDIPTSKLFLKNGYNKKGLKRGPRNGIPTFLTTYAKGVKHLHLECFSIYLHPNQLNETLFLEEFPNLESLCVDKLNTWRRSIEYLPMLPTSFQKLKSLDLNVNVHNLRLCPMWWVVQDTDIRLSLTYWLSTCPKLENLRVSMESRRFRDFGDDFLALLNVAIEGRRPEDPQWKSIEFSVDINWTNHSATLNQFLYNCTTRNIALSGIHSSWLVDAEWWVNRYPQLLQEHPPRVPSTITAIRFGGIPPDTVFWTMDFTQLKRLEIAYASEFVRASDLQVELGNMLRATWTNSLTSIKLRLDEWLWRLYDNVIDKIVSLFNRLSDGAPLTTLKEFELVLPCGLGQEFPRRMQPQVADLLVRFAPNLKKLTLDHWFKAPNVLINLWPRLPHLEELKFKHCRGVRDASFIGRDNENPAFLTLNRLRKLSLEGNATLSGNLDNFFASVLPRMSLTHFSVTIPEELARQKLVGWLQSMPREGAFAESIQKITVNDCPLHKVDFHRELRKIGKTFRSSKMI